MTPNNPSQVARGIRRGVTLIELLTVVFILGILVGLSMFFYPSYSAKQKMVRATDIISGMLIRAKQQAKRDGVPTGIQIVTTGTTSVEIQMIQQPDTVSLGRITTVIPNGTTQSFVTFDIASTVGNRLISSADTIEINGGGKLYQIVGTGSSGVFFQVTINAALASETYPPNADKKLSNYRVFPRPQLLDSEAGVTLPPTTQVTLTKSVITADGTVYNVLFSPAGNVINQPMPAGPPGGMVLLVIEDNDPTSGGAPLVVGIQMRSGLIGVYPYTVGFTLVTPDRNSGM